MTKIKDHTHIIKVEFQSVEAANMKLERGILLFHMLVASDQITKDEFISIWAFSIATLWRVTHLKPLTREGTCLLVVPKKATDSSSARVRFKSV